MYMSTITKFNEKVHNEKVDIITINNDKYNMDDIKREYRCVFKCIDCDITEDKCIRQIIKTGFYCSECTSRYSLEKKGKKYWSKDIMNNYFDCVILKYNLSSRIYGSLSKYKMLFQDLLKNMEKIQNVQEIVFQMKIHS